MDEVCIVGGWVTLSGVMAVLKHENIGICRRTVLNWVNRSGVPKTMIGTTLVIPQYCLRQIIADYSA